MKTMGLEQLYLVNPKLYPSAEATARASGADDVLFRAKVCASLEQALAGCSLVCGTSARSRTIRWAELEVRACAELVVEEATHSQVAIVFGREHSGLTNAELERCHYLVRIPTAPAYSSLNLAAAVQVVCYELLMAMRETLTVPPKAILQPTSKATGEPATAEEMERFYEHLEQVLVKSEFLDPANPRKLLRRLRRLFNRARPDKTELNILRGILAALCRSPFKASTGRAEDAADRSR
jgi:tRNA (cytidine32/uridine32-2'-O)-methyltransferase